MLFRSLVAISLALDVFAVSVGVGVRGASTSLKFRIGAAFACAEVTMNGIGALLGLAVERIEDGSVRAPFVGHLLDDRGGGAAEIPIDLIHIAARVHSAASADALMLSAESAAGAFPKEAVAIMDAIIRRVEADPSWASLKIGRAHV